MQKRHRVGKGEQGQLDEIINKDQTPEGMTTRSGKGRQEKRDGEHGRESASKKSPTPQLIVESGLITVGLRKGEEEGLLSDRQLQHYRSEHV